jgi:hypothetical protein
MNVMHRARVLLPSAAVLGILLGGSGCALRATTDFGPQSESAKHSVSAGPEGMPGVPIYGNRDLPPGGGQSGSSDSVGTQ